MGSFVVFSPGLLRGDACHSTAHLCSERRYNAYVLSIYGLGGVTLAVANIRLDYVLRGRG